VEVTMNKVFNVLESDYMDYSNILNILPPNYFYKWVN
jgi:hypothetical protein